MGEEGVVGSVLRDFQPRIWRIGALMIGLPIGPRVVPFWDYLFGFYIYEPQKELLRGQWVGFWGYTPKLWGIVYNQTPMMHCTR